MLGQPCFLKNPVERHRQIANLYFFDNVRDRCLRAVKFYNMVIKSSERRMKRRYFALSNHE